MGRVGRQWCPGFDQRPYRPWAFAGKAEEGQPTVWMTYVSVEDAASSLAKAGEAGGETVVEPMDVRGLGTMAVFRDPTGAVCGIWQPGTFAGAELVNEYGCFGWNELGTRDVAAAREFYAAVFGWSFEDQDMGEMGVYTILKVGEAIVGGMLDIGGRVPDEVPAHWLTYFTVEDYDAAAAAIEAGGGAVVNGPMDIQPGRMAVVNDPSGAVFAIMEPSAETLENAP